MRKILPALLLSLATIAAVMSGTAAQRSTGKSSAARNMNIFNSVVKELQATYVDTIDLDELTRGAIDYMLSQVDPYTE